MSDNNFFQLVAELKKNIDWLNTILIGGDTETVNINNVIKPSISKDIADKWRAITAMANSRLAFEKKSTLDDYTPNNNDFLDENLLISASWKNGFYLNLNKENAFSTFKFTTNYIPVLPHAKYSKQFSATYDGVVYDAAKNVISNLVGKDGEQFHIHVMPANAAFVRLNMPISEPNANFSKVATASLLAEVWNDTKEKNGLYGWDGSEWVKSNFDRFEMLQNELNSKPWNKINEINPRNLQDVIFSDDVVNGEFDNINLLESTSISWKHGFYLNNSSESQYSTYMFSETYIEVIPDTQYKFGYGARYSGVIYDINKNVIKNISEPSDSGDTFISTMPPNAAFIRVNFPIDISADKFYVFAPKRGFKIKGLIVDVKVVPLVADSHWRGKKIAWYGTSIPAGFPHQNDQEKYSYANKSCRALGAMPLNYCVPNGTIRRFKSNGTAYSGPSFLNTSAAINYQNKIVNLINTNDEPDLFIFDFGVNDISADSSDTNKIDLDDLYSADSTKLAINTRDKNTFVGAYNFVIDELLKAKPKARFAFVTHFSNDERAENQENFYWKMNQVIIALAKHWNAPVLKMHRKTGWVNRDGHNLVKLYNPDGIHPATDSTGDAVDILTKLSSAFLRDVI